MVLHLMTAGGDQHNALAQEIATRLPPRARILQIFNKIDLTGEPARRTAGRSVALSATQGLGIDLLRAELLELVGWQGTAETLFTARERHVQALTQAQAALDRAQAFRRAARSRSSCLPRSCAWRSSS